MSAQTPFHLFIELIQFDRKLQTVFSKIAKLDELIKVLLKQEEDILEQYNKIYQNEVSFEKAVKQKELDMAMLDQEQKQKKVRLESAQNNKEYQSAKHELEIVQAKQLELEEELIAVWNRFELAKKKSKDAKTQYNVHHAELKKKINEAQEEQDILEKEIEDQEPQRKEKEQLVPEEWLEKYNTMRMRIPDPVLPVVDDSCSGCFYCLTNQEIISINKNKLIQCKGCYRFLYNKAME